MLRGVFLVFYFVTLHKTDNKKIISYAMKKTHLLAALLLFGVGTLYVGIR